MCNLKTTQMDVHCSQVWELKYMNLNWDATKNICCAEGESAVNHCTVTRGFKTFCSGCKNLEYQVRSGMSKTGFRVCSCNSLRQIQQVTFEEHLARSTSHSSIWF